MNLADLSIKRPVFITSIVTIMIAVGWLSMNRMGVDLFPDITFPFVTVTTIYPGAGPNEIETLISKTLEDELSSLNGVKRLSSISQEGVSRVFAEFLMETDVKYAEQQIRDRVGAAKRKLPKDIQEPIIRRIDPGDLPVLMITLTANLEESKLYDLADEIIRPKLEQVPQVGVVELFGGRKREIQVLLDRKKLKARELTATIVSTRLSAAGENIPLGKLDEKESEVIFRNMGEFKNLDDIRRTVVNFYGNDIPTTVGDVSKVVDTLADESNRAYLNGKKAFFLNVYRQSGANTIAVVDAVHKRIQSLNEELKTTPGAPQLKVIRDSSLWIHANVTDVKESILIGVVLAVLVVYFFLGNGRSTIITGLALPNSLIGAFVLMAAAGFTVNIMSLLALSLSVGLLIDDAIVVRENIFRHIEMKKPPGQAAREGTIEVTLAVIATTLTVIAVFGPVGFLQGIIGQFFKQFGLTICFAMAISLFDAMTVAPMLSAYFAGIHRERTQTGLWNQSVGRLVEGFGRFQDWLEIRYVATLKYTLKKPLTVLTVSLIIFLISTAAVLGVPKTFMSHQDAGEFSVALDMPPGTPLNTIAEVSQQVDEVLRKNPEIDLTALTVGGRNGESNQSEFYIKLVPAKKRNISTSLFKEKIREQLKPFAKTNPKVKDFDPMGSGQRPFMLQILGNDQAELELYGTKVLEEFKKFPGLKDVDIDFRPGKPEFQIIPDPQLMKAFGISSNTVGFELRSLIDGMRAAKLRENGKEYDIRVRLQEDQRNLREGYASTYVPNMNFNLIRLGDFTTVKESRGPASITRQNKSRYVSLSADIAVGAGLGDIMNDTQKLFKEKIQLPPGMRYAFVGQGENFKDLIESMLLAIGYGCLFIFLVLASLYESFVTPLTIMLALPLALCGSFVALFVTQESLNLFSMIGCVMLLGVATKNSILLVDYANQQIEKGMSRTEAMLQAGKTRLRPILMTTMALIAGTFPVALGLNEASRQRTSMGITIIGGLISSTLLTLVVVPAAYSFIDRFRVWSKQRLGKLFGAHEAE